MCGSEGLLREDGGERGFVSGWGGALGVIGGHGMSWGREVKYTCSHLLNKSCAWVQRRRSCKVVNILVQL